jgi:hypothetical protein
MNPPTCPYCGQPTKRVFGADLYQDRPHQHLANKPFWACRPCQAWTGCHPGTDTPLGTPARKLLRRLRIQTHRTFDPLWKKRRWDKQGEAVLFTRDEAYTWLAKELGLPEEGTHIGMMDETLCHRTIKLARDKLREHASIPFLDA